MTRAGPPPVETGALSPMEARLVSALPDDEGWQFEPKWDGFRCLAVCDGDTVDLRSKAGKPLGRYFPEIVAALAAQHLEDTILDGELVVPIGTCSSFGALQARLHPAESRIRKLSGETPAQLILFDCLKRGGRSLIDAPLDQRRAALEAIHARLDDPRLLLSPFSLDRAVALGWLDRSGGALDGIVAKRRDGTYQSGERAMLKLKQQRSADCVVGGFRTATGSNLVGSLLLGLYDDEGLLDHVGFCSGLANEERCELTGRLEALIEPPGFTGKAPGGPSRWSTERSQQWQPLRPELVVEVRYDQVTDRRFRHGTGLLRWRPDKAPHQCRFDQLQRALEPSELADIVRRS
jgi:ATP-dependent DNA ligase